MRIFRFASLPILLLALHTAAFAQNDVSVKDIKIPTDQSAQTPDDPNLLKLNAQVVVLDVVVTDKAGNIVPNLKKDDFLVTENKLPQTIRTLDAPAASLPAQPPAINSTAELDRLEPRAPVSIIVLGEATLEFNDQAYMRYSLKKYLDAQGETLSQPVMLAAIDNKRFTVLRDYTTSKKEVEDALEHHLVGYAWQPTAKGLNVYSMLAALSTVAKATAGHPGHKNLIWIGTDFGAMNVEGLPPEQIGKAEVAIAKCTNLLRDSRVTLYSVDPKGVGADIATKSVNAGDDPFGGGMNLAVMAVATGGKMLRRGNDVDAEIGTSLRDGINFYTLTYVPPPTGDDETGFREIKIKMKNPDYRASARQGYFAKSPALAPVRSATGRISTDVVQDINIAARSLLVYDGLPLVVGRDPASNDKDKYILHIQGSERSAASGSGDGQTGAGPDDPGDQLRPQRQDAGARLAVL